MNHQTWLREHFPRLTTEAPPSIGSETCRKYGDAEKGECNPNCPFYSECTPYFEELAKELEKLTEASGGKLPT